MMLNNSYKADQAKRLKTELGFDFILEQIFNLHSQCKISDTKSMKISFKLKDKKKNLKDFYPYCLRPSHIEEKFYYKHFKHASQKF